MMRPGFNRTELVLVQVHKKLVKILCDALYATAAPHKRLPRRISWFVFCVLWLCRSFSSSFSSREPSKSKSRRLPNTLTRARAEGGWTACPNLQERRNIFMDCDMSHLSIYIIATTRDTLSIKRKRRRRIFGNYLLLPIEFVVVQRCRGSERTTSLLPP